MAAGCSWLQLKNSCARRITDTDETATSAQAPVYTSVDMSPRKSTEYSSDYSSLLEDGRFTDDALEECLGFFEAQDAAKSKATQQVQKKNQPLCNQRKEAMANGQGSKQLHTMGPGGSLQRKTVRDQDWRDRENFPEAKGESRKENELSDGRGIRTVSKGPNLKLYISESRLESRKEERAAETSNESEGKRIHESDLSGPDPNSFNDGIKTSVPSHVIEQITAITNTRSLKDYLLRIKAHQGAIRSQKTVRLPQSTQLKHGVQKRR